MSIQKPPWRDALANPVVIQAAGMAVSMAVLAGTNYRLTELNDKRAGIGQAIFLFVFNTFFAIGWLGMTWLYPAEIVPLRIRAPTNALATRSVVCCIKFKEDHLTDFLLVPIGSSTSWL